MNYAVSLLMLAGLAAAAPSVALAADDVGSPAQLGNRATNTTPARSADQHAHTPPKLALSDAELGNNRGGQTIVAGNQTLNSNTLGNILNGSYTAGSVNISNSAFSNYNGIGNFAINTGAQVSLQSAMNLTINVAP